MPINLVGCHITPTSKSKHFNMSGTIVADYGSHVYMKVDDESYHGASRDSQREGKYLQIDSLLYKINKDPNE